MIAANALVRILRFVQPVKGVQRGSGTPDEYAEIRAQIEPTTYQPLAVRQAGQLVQARMTAWIDTPSPGMRIPQVGDVMEIVRVYYRNSPLRELEGRAFRIVDVDPNEVNIRLALQEAE